MEFVDTQIISYKYKGNKELFAGDINGRCISSIVALEFLGIMIKGQNRAKMYPVKLKGPHPGVMATLEHKKRGFELGKNSTDKLVIDFNGEFDSIVIYSNEAISHLINEKDLDTLLLFAQLSLDKEEYKKFRERAQFLVDNNMVVVPITREIVNRMYGIYEDIKHDYNVKDNYRNSFMDLLIVATAVEKREKIISKDKELNKVLKKRCGYLNVSIYAEGITCIHYQESNGKNEMKNDNKGYVNNSWKVMIRKDNIT